jgi:hypothetical protein
MAEGRGFSEMSDQGSRTGNGHTDDRRHDAVIHPAWLAFVRYCRELQHGEIDCLKIQDGLPVLAEVTKKKVKFA